MIATLVLIIRLINLFLIGLLIFKKRKDPPLLMSWILVLLFIPIVGFVLYLLFERTPTVSKSLNYIDTLEQKVSSLEYTSTQTEPIQSLITYNVNYNHSPLTGKNKINLFSDGKSKYEQLFQDLKEAKESIHFLYFIIRKDEIGQQFVQLLAEKAAEGVEVRVVYDGAGCFGTSPHFFDLIKQAGGKVFNFHPAKFRLIGLNYNYRNHRKIVVIDGKIAYMGGMNVGKEYMSLDPKYTPWRDAHLRLEGESIRFLQLRFLRDYFMVCQDETEQAQIKTQFMKYFPAPFLTDACEVQIVSDGPDTPTDDIKSAMIKMIQIATQSIRIQTPYFIPDALFLEALKMAAYSGVHVQLMIPTIADHHYVYRTTTSFISELRQAGIEVYLFKGFLHSKVILIDQKICTVGSTNIDQRSFKINYEVNAFIYQEVFAIQLSQQFDRDLDNCMLADEAYENSKSPLMKVEESFYRIISMIL